MFQQSGTGISGKNFFISIVAALVLVVPGMLAAAADNDDIIRRIAPAGSVCVVGDSCAGSATIATGSGDGPQDPEQIYNTYCVACHGSGANNAPIMGDAATWQPRIEKGIDTLYESALNGFNNGAMPPKGLCMNCAEEAVKATVDYILSAVQ